MRLYASLLTWFLSLTLILAACSAPRATEIPAPTSLIGEPESATAAPQTATRAWPSPSATQPAVARATITPTRQLTSAATELPRPATLQPTVIEPKRPSAAAGIAPSGEIAYYDFGWHTLHLKALDPPGEPRLAYETSLNKSLEKGSGITWTPDGKQVAFIIQPDNEKPDIYLLTIGADEPINLTRSVATAERYPAVSPNGKLIAFVSDQDKADKQTWDIYTMRIDGSGVKRLFDCQERCLHPRWSPDGEKLVFQMGSDLYRIPAKGGKPSILVSGAYNWYPTWSPDGQWIAFIRSQSRYSGYLLYLVKPDGSGIQAVVDEEVALYPFTWSPDSQFVAIAMAGEQHWQGIKAFDIESGAGFVLVDDAYTPAWRPTSASRFPEPTTATSAALPDCTGSWSRLKAGEQAQVTGKPGDPANRVRLEPSLKGAQVGVLEPGAVVLLLEGPRCVDGLVWWKVSAGSLPNGVGWTAEGDGQEYWLQPYE